MMIFTRLELINFKSHANTTLDFNPGISLIVGENGAGKSSIFEAISFALFKSYTTKSIHNPFTTLARPIIDNFSGNGKM